MAEKLPPVAEPRKAEKALKLNHEENESSTDGGRRTQKSREGIETLHWSVRGRLAGGVAEPRKAEKALKLTDMWCVNMTAPVAEPRKAEKALKHISVTPGETLYVAEPRKAEKALKQRELFLSFQRETGRRTQKSREGIETRKASPEDSSPLVAEPRKAEKALKPKEAIDDRLDELGRRTQKSREGIET